MQLNEKQEEAKNHIDWPMLIIAWAWSWKTATVTKRVEFMIKENSIPANNILCVTFTNKAAREMRERICKTLNITIKNNNYYKDYRLPLIGTFHAIWVLFLKEVLAWNFAFEVSEKINLKKDFVIYDESDKLAVLRNIIKEELKLDEKSFPARQIAFFISNAKNSLITPKAYENYIDSKIKEVVSKVYYKYEQKLWQNNAIDFDDILVKTLNILQIPQILEFYQEKFKYIMVDEYQDTNAPQYEIIKILASKYRNLAVVWDDWQSIYSFRWADMKNILNFKKDYPEAKIVKLEQNYRSTKTIVLAANEVVKHNSNWMKKELWTDNVEWNKIIYLENIDDRSESKNVVNIIKEKKENYSDNLILYRTNWQSRLIEEALLREWIPYRVIWGLKFYDRKEIKDILSYLKVIHNNSDLISTKRIINVPTRKIWDRSIEIMDNYRENFNLTYFQIIENIEDVEELKPQARKWLLEFYEIIKKLYLASKELTVSALIKEIVAITNYEEYLKQEFSKDEFDAKLDNIKELENVASEFNWMEPRESLSQFLDEVALITDLDRPHPDPLLEGEGEKEDLWFVTLMTVHTSKWLEQKRVFILGLEDWLFPHSRSLVDPSQMEEERRLMYVAMTRAREELYISRAKERFNFGDYVRNPESRFIKEIPKEFIENYEFPSSNIYFWAETRFNNFELENEFKNRTITVKPKISNNISEFSKWDRVSHHKFWTWIITSLNWELAEIAFSGKGIVKMNIKIAPVKKVV